MGVASGRLQGSNLSWDTCDYGPNHGTNNWSPYDGRMEPAAFEITFKAQWSVSMIVPRLL